MLSRKPMSLAKWLLISLVLLIAADRSVVCYVWHGFRTGSLKIAIQERKFDNFLVVLVVGDNKVKSAKVSLYRYIFPDYGSGYVREPGSSFLIPRGQEARVNQMLARTQPQWNAHVEVLERRADGTQYLHVTSEGSDMARASWYVASKDEVQCKYIYWFRDWFVDAMGLCLAFVTGMALLILRCVHVAVWDRRNPRSGASGAASNQEPTTSN